MSYLIDQIVAEVRTWNGIETGPHRFGGTEFSLEGREIGHVHQGGLVDIGYSPALRDELVAEGYAQPHHIYPDSPWTSFYVRQEADVQRAIWLFRVSLLRHYVALARHAAHHPQLPTLDIPAELAQLHLSDPLSAIFSEM